MKAIRSRKVGLRKRKPRLLLQVKSSNQSDGTIYFPEDRNGASSQGEVTFHEIFVPILCGSPALMHRLQILTEYYRDSEILREWYDQNSYRNGCVDKAWKGTKRFEVSPGSSNREFIVAKDLAKNEAPSRRPSLSQFLLFVASRTPLNGKDVLYVWGHGSAWAGVAAPSPVAKIAKKNSQAVGWSNLSPLEAGRTSLAELSDAILCAKTKHKLGLIIFEACYMASIEVAFQLRQCTKLVLASQEVIEPAHGIAWHEAWMSAICKTPRSKWKNDSAIIVAREAMQSFKKYYHWNSKDDQDRGTLSLVNTEKVKRLVHVELAHWLTSAMSGGEDTFAILRKARGECCVFGIYNKNNAPDEDYFLIDLGRFLKLVAKYSDKELSKTSLRAYRSLMSCSEHPPVVGKGRQGGYGSTGLSIFFPEEEPTESAVLKHIAVFYDRTNPQAHDFSRESLWPEFLRCYWKYSSKKSVNKS